MTVYDSLLKEIISDITPTEDDRRKENEMLKGLMNILSSVIQSINPQIEPVMVGSIAKDTDLKGDKDFDIFIQFPVSVTRKDLESQGLDIGKRFFSEIKARPEISYAEHPYVKGRYHSHKVEIVPCYKISKGDAIISAVDRSPLHTNFVMDELAKKPTLRGDIRALKRFMKANSVYGAHAAVEGFSGYLCELLVIKYGSFLDVLKAAKEWKKHEHIMLGKTRTKSTAKFPDAPLVFIDPVDQRRNVAAAVSVEKLAKIIYLSEAFLENPNKKFFKTSEPLPMGKKEFYNKLHKRGTQLIAIQFKSPELIEDTLVPQLAKSLRAIVQECSSAGFMILKKAHWTDGHEVVFLLDFEVWELPRVMKKVGPFFDSKVADLRGFIESNKAKAMSKPYLEGGHWTIDVEREYRHVDSLISDYLKDPKAFGKDLRDVKKFHIRTNSEINNIRSPDFWKFMSTFW